VRILSVRMQMGQVQLAVSGRDKTGIRADGSM
jgi:hypothetical protein